MFVLHWTINSSESEQHTKPLSVSVLAQPQCNIREFYMLLSLCHYGKQKCGKCSGVHCEKWTELKRSFRLLNETDFNGFIAATDLTIKFEKICLDFQLEIK